VNKHFSPARALATALTVLICPALARADGIEVRAGTEVRLVLQEPLSSETAFPGQQFRLLLDRDIRAHGRVVIARGESAFGTVVSATKSEMGGAEGELSFRIDYLVVDGRHIPLRAATSERGDQHVLGSALVSSLKVVAFPFAVGVLIHGKDVRVPVGTMIPGYIDANVEMEASPIPSSSDPQPPPGGGNASNRNDIHDHPTE
jgi:hypothetical protein